MNVIIIGWGYVGPRYGRMPLEEQRYLFVRMDVASSGMHSMWTPWCTMRVKHIPTPTEAVGYQFNRG